MNKQPNREMDEHCKTTKRENWRNFKNHKNENKPTILYNLSINIF